MTSLPTVHFFMDTLKGGGAERALTEIINHIDSSKFKVVLLLAKKEGVYLQDINQNIQIIELLDKKPISGKLYIIKKLIRHINLERPDIMVGFTTPINRFLILSKIFSKSGTSYVLVEQNNVFVNIARAYGWGVTFFMKQLTKMLYRKADLLVAVSEGIRSDLIRNISIKPSKCITIYNPINVSKVRHLAEQSVTNSFKETQDKVIVAVGRLVPQKGYLDMIEVIQKVNQHINCKLFVLGEGKFRKQLEERIKLLELEDKIHLLGFRENPWAYIKSADLFLSTSYWEGFSLAHLEAMACNTPLILTDCNFGPKELIVTGENGILVPVGNTDRIALEVEKLLMDESMKKKLRENAMKFVYDFDSAKITNSYEALFNKLINKKFTL